MNNPISRIPLIAQVQTNNTLRTAIIDSRKSYTYQDLLDASAKIATTLLDGKNDLAEARVAYLVPSAFEYPAMQWGIWRAGGIAVPLCTMHPANELAYAIEDSGASIIVAHPQYADILRPIAENLKRRFLTTDEVMTVTPRALPDVSPERGAMIVYTSGTTSKPKGVLTTHENIAAQINSLIEAWGWMHDDHILLFLPLHHLHGIINVLCSALWAGAVCEMLPRFEAEKVWDRLREGGPTLFMAVPTIYARLVKSWNSASAPDQQAMTIACKKLRLMVSGSAALPVSTLEEWRGISGHTLLERYGMTEIGMALSNPLHGERRPGHVGSPLPDVEVRLVDDKNQILPDGEQGEIQVRGKTVFREYWQRPEATKEAFVDGWFKTGDVAICENNVYRILGRNSVDIIKTGGFKVSALEIEEVLRTHESIEQCAVVGAPDPEWGERVSAAVILWEGKFLDLEALREWAKEHLAVYKVPSRLLILDELPSNAMGKVVKPEVTKLFEGN
jgi:malonyl-CoA/methylmalonyl-CoA synthetase